MRRPCCCWLYFVANLCFGALTFCGFHDWFCLCGLSAFEAGRAKLLRTEAPALLLGACARAPADSLPFLLGLHAMTGFAFPSSHGPAQVLPSPPIPCPRPDIGLDACKPLPTVPSPLYHALFAHPSPLFPLPSTPHAHCNCAPRSLPVVGV